MLINYIASVIFSVVTVLITKKIALTRLDLMDKTALLNTSSNKEIKHPELFVFIPVINMFISVFLIWFVLLDFENAKKLINFIDRKLK